MKLKIGDIIWFLANTENYSQREARTIMCLEVVNLQYKCDGTLLCVGVSENNIVSGIDSDEFGDVYPSLKKAIKACRKLEKRNAKAAKAGQPSSTLN